MIEMIFSDNRNSPRWSIYKYNSKSKAVTILGSAKLYFLIELESQKLEETEIGNPFHNEGILLSIGFYTIQTILLRGFNPIELSIFTEWT